MSKVVYLIDQPLDPRNFDRFGIQNWLERNWKVEVWDLTPLSQPHVWQDTINSGRELSKFDGYFPMTSRSQLSHRFSMIGNIGHFIDLSGDSYYSIRARLLLMRSGAIRVVCAAGSIPDLGYDQERSFRGKLHKVFSRASVRSMKWLVSTVASRFAAPLTQPGLSIVSGEKSYRLCRKSAYDHKILKAHNFDYDHYLKFKESVVPHEDYAVFLDQNICFAPDYVYEDASVYATPEEYFVSLCSGLKKISGILGTPVRIAVHPRFPNTKEFLDYFQGMQFEYGRTAELISGAKFVLCHYSTALQLAVLFKKPLIFITTDQLNSSSARQFIASFATALGKTAVNLDDDVSAVDWQAELRINVGKYADYKREYIKMDGTPEIPHWEIVIDHIEGFIEPLSIAVN